MMRMSTEYRRRYAANDKEKSVRENGLANEQAVKYRECGAACDNEEREVKPTRVFLDRDRPYLNRK